jgi:hypothetical protein
MHKETQEGERREKEKKEIVERAIVEETDDFIPQPQEGKDPLSASQSLQGRGYGTCLSRQTRARASSQDPTPRFSIRKNFEREQRCRKNAQAP